MERSFVNVLLALLLLVSQQLSLLHSYVHTNDLPRPLAGKLFGQAKAGDRGKLPKPALQDVCAQCSASAQMAFALPTPVRFFVPVELAFRLVPAPRTPTLCLLTFCVFQSRAPPSAR